MTEPTRVYLDHWQFLTSAECQEGIMAWLATRSSDEQFVLILVHDGERCCRLLADLRANYAGSLG